MAKIFRKCINAQRTPPLGLANCWECVFSSPPRGRQNGSTKLIPLLRWRGLAAPLFLTRNLVNSANFSIRFQDFQAEKGARKGDRSFFALVTPSWMEKEGGLRLSSGINFHLGKLCWPSPARENPFSTESPDFHPSKNSIINFFEYFSPRLSQISFFDGNREIRAEVYSL